MKITNEIRALNRAVTLFSREMRLKLELKARQGVTGWDYAGFLPDLKDKLHQHAEGKYEGDNLIDIANLAMFVWMLQKDSKQDGA